MGKKVHQVKERPRLTLVDDYYGMRKDIKINHGIYRLHRSIHAKYSYLSIHIDNERYQYLGPKIVMTGQDNNILFWFAVLNDMNIGNNPWVTLTDENLA